MHLAFVQFVTEFERIYYCHMPERMHFCRLCVHLLLHIGPETSRIGPHALFTQWTMERTIGNLGEEVKQPSNPFMNLSQRGLIRSQLNALTAMIPSLDMSEKNLPRGSTDIGNGYALLRARDALQTLIVDCDEVEAIRRYFAENSQPVNPNWIAKVQRWARAQVT